METDVNKLTVEEKLAAAVESSTTETEKEGTKAEEKDTPENRIPQSRFNEVNSALKETKAAEAQAKQQLAEAQASLVRMAELLENKEKDVATLNEIKSYVNDPNMAEHIYAIDRKLKGIEDDVKSGETTPEDASKKVQALVESAREEMIDTQADIQADALITKAESLAERILASLPKEYNDQDKTILGDLWQDKMNWEAAVANPENLANILTSSFQEVVDRYGVPRGALFTADEVKEYQPEVVTPKTPEQELQEEMAKNWGGIVKKELPGGKTVVTPELSDEDFNAALAKAIRIANKR